jgi:hypothetical protein
LTAAITLQSSRFWPDLTSSVFDQAFSVVSALETDFDRNSSFDRAGVGAMRGWREKTARALLDGALRVVPVERFSEHVEYHFDLPIVESGKSPSDHIQPSISLALSLPVRVERLRVDAGPPPFCD